MYNNTIINATINERKPLLIDSSPRDGPTTASSTILAGAGNLPAFKIFAINLASSIVKSPEILDTPPEIS